MYLFVNAEIKISSARHELIHEIYIERKGSIYQLAHIETLLYCTITFVELRVVNSQG